MFKSKSRIHFIYFLIDLSLIALSFYGPFMLNPALVPQMRPDLLNSYFAVYIFWAVVLLFLMQSASLYYTDRYLSISKEWIKVGNCVLSASIFTALFIFFLRLEIFSRTVFIESAISLLLTLSAWRTLKRIYVRHLIEQGYANYNAIVVGAGSAGLALAEEIKSFPFLGIKIIGFIDDNKAGQVNGNEVLGKIEDIERIVNKNFIDEIYVTIPSQRRICEEVIKKGIKMGRSVRILPEYFNMSYRNIKLNYIGTLPLLTYFEKERSYGRGVVKRLLDIITAGFAIIVLSPLFAVIAYLIKLETPGPVFYIAKRSGRKSIAFDFYKFRSMVMDADKLKRDLYGKSEVDGPIFKIRNDPRLTTVGKILRRYSLDELPQLINVIKGDMSIVGPRPFPVEESENFENRHIPRLNIRPGMTGLAQVKGRSDLKFNNCVRWDMWYIANWSLWLDLKILLWTIPVVLKGKGAY